MPFYVDGLALAVGIGWHSALRRYGRWFRYEWYTGDVGTQRLYYDDAYLTRFTARVVARGQRDGRPAVALDRTAFYPEGGGQPADRGLLAGVPVLDVQADGELVWHTLETGLDGTAVEGLVDWARRFDHMQQHLGQHMLSAACEELFGLRTVSFHLGAAAATIDLDAARFDAAQAAALETRVNQVIWEDRPVLARFVDDAELATLRLRKPPAVDGPVRVVSVPEFDHSACGGTHPRSTGGVGLVHVRRWERRGAAIRLEFVCGGRAAQDLCWKNAALGRLAAGLSVGVIEVEDAVARLRAAEEQARKGLEAARAALLGYEAQALAGAAEPVGAWRVVARAFDGRTAEELRALASLLAEAGCVALLGLRAGKPLLLFARGDGIELDCSALLRSVLAPLGGRGGGQAAMAQGGVPEAALVEQALERAVREVGGRR